MSDTAAAEPLVSVIIPVYNAEKYLRETLDCVCNQTLRNIEIICVDDGSTDDSLGILQEYVARDPRFRILQQKNQYAGVARNNGMAVARGKYLSFLDADDLFELDMLEIMTGRAEETGCDIVSCMADGFDDGTDKRQALPWVKNEEVAARLPEGVFQPSRDIPDCIFQLSGGTPWNRLFLRAFVKGNGLQWATTQNANDFGFVFHATALATQMCFIDNICIHYRLRHDSIAHSKGKNPEAIMLALKDLRDRLAGIPCYEAVEHSFYNVLLGQMAWHLLDASPEARKERAELYMKSYEPHFHLLRQPEATFNDRGAHKKLISILAPRMSIVVEEREPAKLLKCLASFGGCNLGGNEIICSKPNGEKTEGDGIDGILQCIPGIRMLDRPPGELPIFARAKRVAVVPEGWMLAPGTGDVYNKLKGSGEGSMDISPFLVRIRTNGRFYRCSPNEKSFRLFGKGIFTIRYSEKEVAYWFLGRKFWSTAIH